ncbi:MAG: NAD(P)H-dependent glycerol-3-phosphate dehydrogenase [Planctomycetota bacterium]
MLDPVAVIGNGGWGTAMALVLAEKGVDVRLWGIESDYVAKTARTRRSPKYLPGIAIPEAILVTPDFGCATEGAGLILSATPTQFLRGTFAPLRALDRSGGAPVLSLSKGIEVKTLLRPTQILREVLGRRKYGALVGPSHAEEVARGLPAAVVIGATDEEFAKACQETVSTSSFRAYTTTDTVGVELSSALKNVLAIAAGIVDGFELGDNAKAALLTRGMVEMARLGVALGANRQTFSGLAGIGDIITTCVSPHGRNRAVGERIGRGERVRDILDSMTMVAEGVPTTKAVVKLAKRHGIEMPIAEQIHRVLFHGKSPKNAVRDLMLRTPKSEVEEYR